MLWLISGLPRAGSDARGTPIDMPILDFLASLIPQAWELTLARRPPPSSSPPPPGALGGYVVSYAFKHTSLLTNTQPAFLGELYTSHQGWSACPSDALSGG